MSHYLQKNLDSKLETVWDDPQAAPGDGRVRLRSVRVIPQTSPDDPITIHTPLRIEFTYWNYVPDTVLNVSMILNSAEEVCVFASVSDFLPRPVGLIRHTVTIPGDLLNAGSYYVNMIVVKDASVGILYQNNVAGFEVVKEKSLGIGMAKRRALHVPSCSGKADPLRKIALRSLRLRVGGTLSYKCVVHRHQCASRCFELIEFQDIKVIQQRSQAVFRKSPAIWQRPVNPKVEGRAPKQ